MKHIFWVAVTLCVVLVGCSGSSVEEKPPEDGELEQTASVLLSEQQDEGAVLAVQGTSFTGIGGILIAQALPELDASELEPGDTYSAPTVGATRVGEDGEFSLKLDPDRVPLTIGDNNVYLVHVGDDKEPVAAMGVNLLVGTAGAQLDGEGQPGLQIQAISVDLIESTSEPLASEDVGLGQPGIRLDGEEEETVEADGGS